MDMVAMRCQESAHDSRGHLICPTGQPGCDSGQSVCEPEVHGKRSWNWRIEQQESLKYIVPMCGSFYREGLCWISNEGTRLTHVENNCTECRNQQNNQSKREGRKGERIRSLGGIPWSYSRKKSTLSEASAWNPMSSLYCRGWTLPSLHEKLYTWSDSELHTVTHAALHMALHPFHHLNEQIGMHICVPAGCPFRPCMHVYKEMQTRS